MQGEFSKRGVGVRPKGGRPRLEAPAEVLEILRQTHDEGGQYNLDIRGVDQSEVAQFARLVANGAAELGWVAKIYGLRSGRTLRFWAEDEEPA